MKQKIYDIETHYLTIEYAKDLGLDKRNRVMSFDPMAFSREQAGLTPLLVYTLVAPAFCRYFRSVVDPRSARPISEFLAEAWSSVAGIGMPLVLEVKPRLLQADMGYVEWLERQGVEARKCIFPKAIDAFERASTKDVRWSASFGDITKPEYPRSIEDANKCMIYHDGFVSEHCSMRLTMESLSYEAWKARDKRFISEKSLATNDWSSSRLAVKAKELPDPHLMVDHNNEDVICVDGIKDFVDMWIGGPSEFFRKSGVKKYLFESWVNGYSHLERSDMDRLMSTADIQIHARHGEYQLNSGYLLMAKTALQTIRLYDSLTHGCDIEYAFEVIGPEGELSKRRFFIFERCGAYPTIFLFERDGKAEKVLTQRKYLCNSSDAVRAPADIWKVVSMISDTPENILIGFNKLGEGFWGTHKNWLESLDWPCSPSRFHRHMRR